MSQAAPVNQLQQEIAAFLVGLGGHGSKLWFLAGVAGAVVLVALAFVPFLPASARERWGGRLRLRWVLGDAWYVLAAIVVICVLRLPVLSQLELNPDESGLILGARTLLHDPRFWISFENTTLGPLSTFALASIGLLGFPIDFTTIRIVGVAIMCLVAVLLFFGLRILYTGTLARMYSLPVIALLAGMNYWDYVAFNGEHMAVLMLAIAFWLHAPLLLDDGQPKPARALFLGLVLALVPLAKIQPGPIALAWGVFACVHAFLCCRKHLVFLCAGAAIPVAALALYLTASGAWHDFWQSYVLNNLLYASDGWNATQQDVTFWHNSLRFPAYLLSVRDSRGFVVFCGLVVTCAAALAVISSRFRTRLRSFDVGLGLVITGAAAVSVIMPKNNWTHYLFLLLVPASVFTAALLARFFETAREGLLRIRVDMIQPELSWMIRGEVFLAAGVALFGVMLPLVHAMGSGHPANQVALQNLEGARDPGPVIAGILRHAHPGEPVAHWGVRLTELAQSGVSMGTRDAHNERALYPSRQQSYYLKRWISDVETRKPRVLVDTCTGEYFDRFRLTYFPQQLERVLASYRLAEEVDGFQIYVRKDDAES